MEYPKKTSSEALSIKVIREIQESLDSEDLQNFMQIIGNCTPSQLIQYQHSTRCHRAFVPSVWRVSVTWGFELWWNELSQMTPEEVEQLRRGDPQTDVEVPENLMPHLPLNKHRLWAPQDHMDRLTNPAKFR